MPEEIEHLDFEPEDNSEPEDEAENDSEPDAAMVAFLDQESATFRDAQGTFESVYGFKHDCHCSQDYADGNTAEVTECYLGMMSDAMDTLAQEHYENKVLRVMVNQMVTINNGLMDKMTDLGLEAELQEYMSSPMDVESLSDLVIEGEAEEEEGKDDEPGEDALV